MAPIRVGIIGYGNSARTFHLPYITRSPDYEVVAFLQRAEPAEGKRHVTVDYPKARWHRSIEEFCADKDIDLGIVITGHNSHAELAEKVLESGKHVAVEKPFTCTSEEADRVIAIAKKAGKIVAPFQNRRYDSDYRTLEALVNQGVFGPIHEAEIHYDWDAPSWVVGNTNVDLKPGDGMGLGIGSHSLDQALALFGRPSTVTGFFRALRPVPKSRSEDSFTILLEYAGDDDAARRLVTVKTKIYTKMYPPLKYLVSGRDGTYIKFGLDPQEDQAHAGMTPDDHGFGVEGVSFHGELTTATKVLDGQVEIPGRGVWLGKVPSLKGDYTLFYADLAAAVRGERELKVKAETSRDGIKIVELARESSETGKTLKFE